MLDLAYCGLLGFCSFYIIRACLRHGMFPLPPLAVGATIILGFVILGGAIARYSLGFDPDLHSFTNWVAALLLPAVLAWVTAPFGRRIQPVRPLPDPAIQARMYESAVHSHRGWTFMEAGDLQNAVDELQSAVRIDDGNAAAWTNLGLALARTGRWTESVEALEKAVATDPKLAEAHHTLAIVYLDQGNHDLARKHVRIARKLGLWVQPEILRILDM